MYLQSQASPTPNSSPFAKKFRVPETSDPKPLESQVVTKEVHSLSPLLQFQLSSVVSVPGLSQGPWEIADSTERREEARRMKIGTSILVIEGCPALWACSFKHPPFIQVEGRRKQAFPWQQQPPVIGSSRHFVLAHVKSLNLCEDVLSEPLPSKLKEFQFPDIFYIVNKCFLCANINVIVPV